MCDVTVAASPPLLRARIFRSRENAHVNSYCSYQTMRVDFTSSEKSRIFLPLSLSYSREIHLCQSSASRGTGAARLSVGAGASLTDGKYGRGRGVKRIAERLQAGRKAEPCALRGSLFKGGRRRRPCLIDREFEPAIA